MGLTQYPRKKFSANIPLMRIWYPDGDISSDHELVFPTGIWPFKAGLPQTVN
jgi:hypothetical protein